MTTEMSAPEPSTIPDLSVTTGFDDAARAVLEFLGERLPWALWAVTRIENGNQTVLSLKTQPSFTDAAAGDSFPWEGSLCVKMVAGEAPRMATDLSRYPAYEDQPVAKSMGAHAYAGVPITDLDGSLFGTLCGINLATVDDDVAQEQPLLELLAHLLGVVLAADRSHDAIERTAQRARLDADTDALTGAYSRRAWDALLASEELHQQSYADPAILVMIDLDGLKAINDGQGHAAGDEYIKRCAVTLKAAVRDSDHVARLGGDEFAVLLRNTTVASVPRQVRRLREALAEADVAASMGWAQHTLNGGFAKAQAAADAAMYEDKLLRRDQLVEGGARGR